MRCGWGPLRPTQSERCGISRSSFQSPSVSSLKQKARLCFWGALALVTGTCRNEWHSMCQDLWDLNKQNLGQQSHWSGCVLRFVNCILLMVREYSAECCCVCTVSQFNSIQFIAGVSIDLSVAMIALHDILTHIGHYSGWSQMYTWSHYESFFWVEKPARWWPSIKVAWPLIVCGVWLWRQSHDAMGW